MKILLTGGAGFIGSAVVRHIIQTTNDIVLNIDKLTYAGNLESLKEVDQNPRYQFQQVDICDSLKLEQAFEQFQPDGSCTWLPSRMLTVLLMVLLPLYRPIYWVLIPCLKSHASIG